MYKLIKIEASNGVVEGVCNTETNSYIPMDESNTDYANFKKEVLAGAELQDANGNVMTQEQADQFVGGLA